MTQLRCCDCGSPFDGLTTDDADADCPGSSRDAQCERCFADQMGWPEEPEMEMPF